jgi:SAM-dependent methyltransferase
MFSFRRDPWLKTLERSLTRKQVSPLGDPLPGFPPEDLQVQTVGMTGRKAMRDAFTFAQCCTQHFRLSPLWSRADKRLLDFGTGWGRIARAFLRDFRMVNMAGVDINAEYLDVARRSFGGGQFLQTGDMPPLADPKSPSTTLFPASGTDFITAYSVFSHLSEQASLAWVEEFARILTPGGMAAITTRGRWFFDTAEAYRGTSVSGYAKGLGEMFDDFAGALARYDAGQIVHANSPLIGDGRHYGETFIPEAYARREFARFLDVVAFDAAPGRHPVIVLRKPA